MLIPHNMLDLFQEVSEVKQSGIVSILNDTASPQSLARLDSSPAVLDRSTLIAVPTASRLYPKMVNPESCSLARARPYLIWNASESWRFPTLASI